MPKPKSKLSKKKRLKLEIARLDRVDRTALVELRPKHARRLLNELEQQAAAHEWKLKSKCCGKKLYKMCARCPRRLLVHLAQNEAGVLDRRA